MDDSFWRADVLRGNIHFRFCELDRPDDVDLRDIKWIGAGMLLSASIVAFRAAF